MKIVIIYESMYGNTRMIAEAIGRGLGPENGIVVVPVTQARPELLDGAGLVVVGGPTHIHGLSRPSTRKGAAAEARKPDRGLTLDPGAEGPGLRDWLSGLDGVDTASAAFDTRLDGPAVFTGRASKGITRPAAPRVQDGRQATELPGHEGQPAANRRGGPRPGLGPAAVGPGGHEGRRSLPA